MRIPAEVLGVNMWQQHQSKRALQAGSECRPGAAGGHHGHSSHCSLQGMADGTTERCLPGSKLRGLTYRGPGTGQLPVTMTEQEVNNLGRTRFSSARAMKVSGHIQDALPGCAETTQQTEERR